MPGLTQVVGDAAHADSARPPTIVEKALECKATRPPQESLELYWKLRDAGLLNSAKVLLFVATRRSCGTRTITSRALICGVRPYRWTFCGIGIDQDCRAFGG